MKKIIIIICIIAMALLAIVLSASLQVEKTSYYDGVYYKKSIHQLDSLRKNHASIHHSLEAGFAKVSITPVLHYHEDHAAEGKFKGVALAGNYSRKGAFATEIHDSIFVRTAAIRVADRLMIIVGSDLLLITQNITDAVLSLLAPDGIGRDQLMLTATHTHSSLGGWGMGYFGTKLAGAYNEQISHWLASQIAISVRMAIRDLKPALIGSGNAAAAAYIRNRLTGATGVTNDDFSYIILEQTEGKKAIIGSFSAHSSVITADYMAISGDYPGYWQRKMEHTFADYAIFCAGAMGSQNPDGVDGASFDLAKNLGEALAEIVTQSASATQMSDSVVFSAMTMKFHLPDFSIRIKNNISTVVQRSRNSSNGAVLQALRLNDMVWISTPADFSGEIALQIKNYLYPKGFNANITGFNGNFLGYIIPSKYYFLEHYESRTMGWYGPNMGDYTTDMIRHLSDIVIR